MVGLCAGLDVAFAVIVDGSSLKDQTSAGIEAIGRAQLAMVILLRCQLRPLSLVLCALFSLCMPLELEYEGLQLW